MAREARVCAEVDEGFGLAPILRLQRNPVAGEGAVVGTVFDWVDEGEPLEEAAGRGGGVGYQLFGWGDWVKSVRWWV